MADVLQVHTRCIYGCQEQMLHVTDVLKVHIVCVCSCQQHMLKLQVADVLQAHIARMYGYQQQMMALQVADHVRAHWIWRHICYKGGKLPNALDTTHLIDKERAILSDADPL